MAKRKNKQLTIDIKLHAIEEAEKNLTSKTEIAKKYDVPLSTLCTWLKNKDSLRRARDSYAPERKRLRMSNNVKIESALFLWVKDQRAHNIPITGASLQMKAQVLAECMGDVDFVANYGWLERFKKRHDIQFGVVYIAPVIHGDPKDNWATVTLPNLMHNYHPNDIFNADEFGLFYKLLPNKSLMFKGEMCYEGKMSKDRLSVLACANMTGSEKLPILVVGKVVKPRCFRGVKSLPTAYRANKRAWMTLELFIEWLWVQDCKFASENRKVALVVTSGTVHPDIAGLKAIELVFLPHDTSIHMQPMCQGIIADLKHNYRTILLCRLLSSMDAKRQPTILQAMHFIQQAWSVVKQTTITQCFATSGFTLPAILTDKPANEPNDNDDLSLAVLLNQLCDAGFEVCGSATDYVAVDDHLVITGPLTDEVIVSRVQPVISDKQDSDDNDDDPTDPPTDPPSHAAVVEMCEQIRLYLQSQADTDTYFPYINAIQQIALRQQYCSKEESEVVNCSL